ncbi:hypothetical protein TNCV_904251 [Trichonephila clavipes]|nr:hypothetical protein TNCV_904251 [Trichonephila clavipes]
MRIVLTWWIKYLFSERKAPSRIFLHLKPWPCKENRSSRSTIYPPQKATKPSGTNDATLKPSYMNDATHKSLALKVRQLLTRSPQIWHRSFTYSPNHWHRVSAAV